MHLLEETLGATMVLTGAGRVLAGFMVCVDMVSRVLLCLIESGRVGVRASLAPALPDGFKWSSRVVEEYKTYRLSQTRISQRDLYSAAYIPFP